MSPATPGKKTTAGQPAASAAQKDARGGSSSAGAANKKLTGEKPTASFPASPVASSSAAAESRKQGANKKNSISTKSPTPSPSKGGGDTRRNSKTSSQLAKSPQNEANAESGLIENSAVTVAAGGDCLQSSPRSVPLICLFGPPCSGKGTLAALLRDNLGMLHCSTGDLLRQIAKEEGENSEVGTAMKAGKLVDDRVTARVLQDAVAKNANAMCKGIILDGFPRIDTQVDLLREMKLWPDVCFLLKVPNATLFQRMAARRVDPVTGQVFGLGSEPTDKEQKQRLIRREDDSDEVLKCRIEEFEANMALIEDKLHGDKGEGGGNSEEKGTLQDGNESEGKTRDSCEVIEVAGDRDILEVFKDVHTQLQQKFPTVFS
ncbi:adenylate kinase superfamily protein [Toxoplasma gondii TgCatPRC2]|uniref:Adenylate kinase superfamily protein n=1 Tax=Toxoplasma gondii TgCatPRC2 TaxID=1130821 RepID=A0A151HBL4_TOXGO|nr:adenylate kinase superfamily protein [Toxoplasma gondii TgCatPRC2]